MGDAIMVGMAEMKFAQSPDDILIALGLGSCICVCAYDYQARIAGMAHVVLPVSHDADRSPGKFADTAIPLFLQSMIDLGAGLDNLRIALTGGAQLFAFHGAGVRLDVGARNAEAVISALERANLAVCSVDIGGSTGRTVQLVGDGRVRVKITGKPERELVHLGQSTVGVSGFPTFTGAKMSVGISTGSDAARAAQYRG